MSQEWQGPLRPGEKPNNEEITSAESPAAEKPPKAEDETAVEKEKSDMKRMPITVETGGGKKNVWVEYQTELEDYVGMCRQCKAKNQILPIEKIIYTKVESDDPGIIIQATEKLKNLIDLIEKSMTLCKKCDNEEFRKKIPELYVEKLEEFQKKIGIEADINQQRKKILENLKTSK